MGYFEIVGNNIVLTFPVKKAEKRTKKELEEEYNNYLIVVNPKRCISLDQMRLTHVLLKQYGDELGYTLDEIKNVLKDEFSLLKEIESFSLSEIDQELATEFIQFIIEHAIKNDVNLYIKDKGSKIKHIRNIVPDIERYVISCLKARRCAICGQIHDPDNNKIIELDHFDNVSEIGGYEFDNGLQTRFLPLCVKHHRTKHNLGRGDFERRYHIAGVYLNENLVRDIKKIYKNHFKAFKEQENE